MLNSQPRLRKLPAFILGPLAPKVAGTLVLASMSCVLRSYQSNVNPTWLSKKRTSNPRSRVFTVSQVRDCATELGASTEGARTVPEAGIQLAVVFAIEGRYHLPPRS